MPCSTGVGCAAAVPCTLCTSFCADCDPLARRRQLTQRAPRYSNLVSTPRIMDEERERERSHLASSGHHESISFVDEDGGRCVEPRHLKEHPDELLRVPPPLGDDHRCRNLKEHRFALRCDCFGQHRLASPRRAKQQNTFPRGQQTCKGACHCAHNLCML